MPPKIKFSREEVLAAAFRLARSGGLETINARAVAKELGCSTQPIFREFSSIEQIKEQTVAMAMKLYESYIQKGAKSLPDRPYLGTGMAYLLFAKEEPALFQMLFMCNREQMAFKPDFEDKSLPFVLSMAREKTGFVMEEAQRFHAHMWVYTHGLASMVATKYLPYDQQAVQELLSEEFCAMKAFFITEEKQKKEGNNH